MTPKVFPTSPTAQKIWINHVLNIILDKSKKDRESTRKDFEGVIMNILKQAAGQIIQRFPWIYKVERIIFYV